MEEIIIDGVNVAGCKYILDDNTCYYEFSNDYEPTPCKIDPDCQYKQLKRLEQENAELKEFIKSINKPITFPLDEEVTNKYKQALEEIREIINNHKKCFYGKCKDCLYYQECEGQNVECDCSKYHIDKINEVLDV